MNTSYHVSLPTWSTALQEHFEGHSEGSLSDTKVLTHLAYRTASLIGLNCACALLFRVTSFNSINRKLGEMYRRGSD